MDVITQKPVYSKSYEYLFTKATEHAYNELFPDFIPIHDALKDPQKYLTPADECIKEPLFIESLDFDTNNPELIGLMYYDSENSKYGFKTEVMPIYMDTDGNFDEGERVTLDIVLESMRDAYEKETGIECNDFDLTDNK